MSIVRELNDLLHDHDCVIVPRWGGFITHYRPARLDETRRLVHPPGKELGFNRHLTRNDGLLADRVARREGIGHDAALDRIATEVGDWQSRLGQDGRLELPHIGLFYHDAERNLQFEPDKRANHLKDAYGLRTVAAIPVKRVAPAPVLRTLAEPAPMAAPVQERSRPWLAAAGLALLLGTASIFLWRAQMQEGTQWSGLDLFGPGPERQYQPPATTNSKPVVTAGIFSVPDGPPGVRTLPLTVNDSVLVTVDMGRPAAPVLVPDSTAVRTPNVTVASPAARERFHVVGGCFAVEENAERFLAELQAQGWPARRLSRSGELHPVAYGSFARRDEALDLLARVRGEASASAWLMVR